MIKLITGTKVMQEIINWSEKCYLKFVFACKLYEDLYYKRYIYVHSLVLLSILKDLALVTFLYSRHSYRVKMYFIQ